MYNYEGIKLPADTSGFYNNMTINYYRDSDANTNYSVIKVFKKKLDGTMQYPFIRELPYGPEYITAYTLAEREGWPLVINGGGWEGPAVQNGAVARDDEPWDISGASVLTIDANGDLGFANNMWHQGSAQTLVNQGIVSAFYYFMPIIVNYEDYDWQSALPDMPANKTYGNQNWVISQKQIIGQYANGDYCIITAEGRGFNNSTGFSIVQTQTLCKKLGLKFAFYMDGGGSTQTVLGKKRVNHCYYDNNGTTERLLPGFIVFNGTDRFEIPKQQQS